VITRITEEALVPKAITDLFRPLADPRIFSLVFVLLVGSVAVLYLGAALAPFIVAGVVAYLLEGMVRFICRYRVPRIIAILVVFGVFLCALLVFLFVLMPTFVQQLTHLVGELPRMMEAFHGMVAKLAQAISGTIPAEFAESLLLSLAGLSQDVMANSASYLLQQVPGLVSLALYVVLVPFLVFFLLKDKDELIAGLVCLLPRDRSLLDKVLADVNAGVGGYVRGKFWELLILGTVTYIAFAVMGVRYAFLLGLFTGLSVLIPLLGVVVMMVPVVAIGLFQWGLSWEAFHPLMVYGFLQLADANILTPLILGETVKVHPLSIILAVMVFGMLWGVPGVFFAVPLAVLVKSVVRAVFAEPV
jgi:putative permease